MWIFFAFLALLGNVTAIKRVFSVPACETSSTAITSSTCASGRYISLAQQDTVPKLQLVSQGVADLASKSGMARKALATVQVVTAQEALANAIPRAVNDLVIGSSNGVSQAVQAVNLANTTATRMTTDLGNQFNTLYRTVDAQVIAQLQAARLSDIANINTLIRDANTINTKSAANAWTSGLDDLIATAETHIAADASAVDDKQGLVKDASFQVPSSISLSLNNITNELRAVTDSVDTNMVPRVTSFADGMTAAVTSAESGLNAKVAAAALDLPRFISAAWVKLNTTLATRVENARISISRVNASQTAATAAVTALADSAVSTISNSGSWTAGNESAVLNATETAVTSIADTVKANAHAVDTWSIVADGLLSGQERALGSAKAAIINAGSNSSLSSALIESIRAAMRKVAAAQTALDSTQSLAIQQNLNALNNLTNRLGNATINFKTMMVQLDQIKNALSVGNDSSSLGIALKQLDGVQSGMSAVATLVRLVAANAKAAIAAAKTNTTAMFAAHNNGIKDLINSGKTFVQNLRNQAGSAIATAKGIWKDLRTSATATNKDLATATDSSIKLNTATTGTIDSTQKAATDIIATVLDQVSAQAVATLNVFRALGLPVAPSFSGGENAEAGSSAASVVSNFQKASDTTANTRQDKFGTGMDEVDTLTTKLRGSATQLFAELPSLISVDQAAALGNVSTTQLSGLNLSTDSVEAQLGLEEVTRSLLAVLNDAESLPSIVGDLNSLVARNEAAARGLASTAATFGSLADSLNLRASQFNSTATSSVDQLAAMLVTANSIDAILEQETGVHATEIAASNASIAEAVQSRSVELDSESTIFGQTRNTSVGSETSAWATALDALYANLRSAVPVIRSSIATGDSALRAGIAESAAQAQLENGAFNESAVSNTATTANLYNALKATVDTLTARLDVTGNDAVIANLHKSLSDVASAVDTTLGGASDMVMGLAGSAGSIATAGTSTSADKYAQLAASANSALTLASGAVDQGFHAADSMDAIIAANERDRTNSAASALNSIAAGKASFDSMLGTAIQTALTGTQVVEGATDGLGFSEFLRNISQQLGAFDTFMGVSGQQLDTFKGDTVRAVETDKGLAKQGLQDSMLSILSGAGAIRGTLSNIALKQEEVDDVLARVDAVEENMNAALDAIIVNPADFNAEDILHLNKSTDEVTGAVAQESNAMLAVESDIDSLLTRAR